MLQSPEIPLGKIMKFSEGDLKRAAIIIQSLFRGYVTRKQLGSKYYRKKDKYNLAKYEESLPPLVELSEEDDSSSGEKNHIHNKYDKQNVNEVTRRSGKKGKDYVKLINEIEDKEEEEIKRLGEKLDAIFLKRLDNKNEEERCEVSEKPNNSKIDEELNKLERCKSVEEIMEKKYVPALMKSISYRDDILREGYVSGNDKNGEGEESLRLEHSSEMHDSIVSYIENIGSDAEGIAKSITYKTLNNVIGEERSEKMNNEEIKINNKDKSYEEAPTRPVTSGNEEWKCMKDKDECEERPQSIESNTSTESGGTVIFNSENKDLEESEERGVLSEIEILNLEKQNFFSKKNTYKRSVSFDLKTLKKEIEDASTLKDITVSFDATALRKEIEDVAKTKEGGEIVEKNNQETKLKTFDSSIVSADNLVYTTEESSSKHSDENLNKTVNSQDSQYSCQTKGIQNYSLGNEINKEKFNDGKELTVEEVVRDSENNASAPIFINDSVKEYIESVISPSVNEEVGIAKNEEEISPRFEEDGSTWTHKIINGTTAIGNPIFISVASGTPAPLSREEQAPENFLDITPSPDNESTEGIVSNEELVRSSQIEENPLAVQLQQSPGQVFVIIVSGQYHIWSKHFSLQCKSLHYF